MPFKPFAHLARVSLAKGITHAYAPSAVVAGQSLGGQLQNYPTSKFAKTQSHLQNAFTGSNTSGTSAGVGTKAGYSTQAQNNAGDVGLAQYYAAWQHAQQTGDDADWRQHQSARRIGWKESDKSTTGSKQTRRLDSIRAADILKRPSAIGVRANSETIVQEIHDAQEALVEAEALAKIDEAISREIKDVQSTHVSLADIQGDGHGTSIQELESSSDAVEDRSSEPNSSLSASTHLTSPIVDEAWLSSNKIVQLGQQRRFAEIPQQFEAMIKDGLVPTADAYNQIIASAIHLSNGYQPYPRALEVYGDMMTRSVAANQETYSVLISHLTSQGLESLRIQKDLAQQRLRYGSSYILPSIEHKHELHAGDTSLQFATKFYNIAVASIKNFALTGSQFNGLLKAYVQSGSAQNMRQLLADMQLAGVPVALELYAAIIDRCGSVKDIDLAQECYRDYRDRAIGRVLDPMDVKVYVSLIRAYYAAGAGEDGLRFYEKVIESFHYSADKKILIEQITDAFVVDGLVQYHIDLGSFEQALKSTEAFDISSDARIQSLNKIATAAADNDEAAIADRVYTSIDAGDISADCATAVSAMHLRANRVDEGQSAWARTQQLANAPAATVGFATMHALSLMKAGKTEEALAHARAMFRQIRTVEMARSTPPQTTNKSLDEVVNLVGRTLSQNHAVHSAQTSILLFRIMIENGGLVPHITRDAIARIGPDCIHQLSAQDIALALHVQAYMLPAQPVGTDDTAQSARFSHLLETILDRGILMDPSTLHAVSDALPRLGGTRPDLERRWHDLMRPSKEVNVRQVVSPVLPHSPAFDQASTFDPYSNTTDHRASRVISDMLDSTSGRIESHIADSMARLRNVRRMGRHLQYSAYAKLVTAASKAKQNNLMHEILGMAQTDVPFNAQVPSVKNGWVQIYDAMVAACLTVGERQLAAKYHQDILALGAAPSANTFGIYITTLEGTFDEATEAVKIFQQAIAEGVTPSVFLFNAVIGKLGKARRIDDCLQYFGQMQNMGIRPSSVTYGTLVNALCRTSEESFAVEMFDEMEAAPNYRPRPAPYNSIIQYFLNTRRDRAKVLQYYGRMRSRNIKPTSHTYKLLIEAYATLEPINLTAAETVLEDMKANGVQPEAVHYGSLIHARGCVMGDMAGARTVFDAVLADPTIRPTDNLYQNLLESMVANHEVDGTDEILADMKKRGIAMTPYIANTLIHGWASKGNIDKARSTYESLGIQKREPSTYEAMTRAFLAVEDHVGAQGVVSEMLQKGYPSAVAEKVLALVGNNL